MSEMELELNELTREPDVAFGKGAPMTSLSIDASKKFQRSLMTSPGARVSLVVPLRLTRV